MNDILKYSLKNLWKRRLRSGLTVLSILVGIAAIFALVSFGQGIEKYMEDFSQEMGIDKILIMPKGLTSPGTGNIYFTEEDMDYLGKIKGVDAVSGWMFASGKIGFKDYRDAYSYVAGFPTSGDEQQLTKDLMGGIDIIEGRDLKDGDILQAVLGYSYMFDKKIFEKGLSTGDKIKINDIDVEVIGFYEEIGNPSDDSQVYLSFEGFKEIFKRDTYEYLAIRAASDENPSNLAERITEKFRKHRNQNEGEEDFTSQTFEEVMATFTNVITIMNVILVLIALVSVFVASVNIVNTMYTSIIERTQEIGVMKAVGARNSTILIIFVIESGLLGLVGGALGILFGYIVAKLGGQIATAYGLSLLQPYFPPWLAIGCLIFATFVGAASGIFPAKRASKLKPVDALRYE